MSDQYRDVELALVDSSRRAGTQHASPPVLPRRRRGYLARALLILVLGAGWFVGLRPYLHGLAQNQIDKVLSNVVNQIALTPISMLPSGPTSLPVTEMMVNNLFVLYTAPSDPVQHMHMQFTPTGLRVDFQVYGFASDFTAVPVASKGQLQLTNVTVEGVFSLIMSSGEIAPTLNAHLRDARAKLHRSIVGVVLKDHEMDIMLS
ncbi:MAG TPA: hypothetical protein VEL69_09630 [Ktedonobacteraceae bacterium]|nr:hypothetical protein [Ktedonobacteraceae bacterium]